MLQFLQKLLQIFIRLLLMLITTVFGAALMCFVLLATIWDLLKEKYIQRFRPELVRKQAEEEQAMNQLMDLAFLLNELKHHTGVISKEEIKRSFKIDDESSSFEECFELALEKRYFVAAENGWQMSQEGRTFAEEYFATFR